MYKKILIPVENSPADATILNHIRPLAKMMKSSLVLIHVADGFAARLQNQLNLEDSEEIKKDKEYLKVKERELIDDGLNVQSFLVLGEPSDQILSLAEKEQCDLIAMSTHGHKFIKDVILGSVAENIRHRTNIPILMVRSGHHPS
jgi:nucleotide-binding universal stress UspA family protein